MSGDLELLDRYVRENCQEAFATVLDRHLPVVYAAALRQVRSPQLAEEVAQSVFFDLSRSAPGLAPETVVAAWLYRVTRRTAVDVIRRESRRQQREQIAFAETAVNDHPADWKAIEPVLDEAMEQLDEPDRTAVLLRFFEEKSLREVGAALGASEDAAQKRVSRALDQLREFFSKRGVAVGASGLALLLTDHSAHSAPLALRAVILGRASSTVGTIALTKTIAMTTLQKSLIGATLALTIGAGVYEAHHAAALEKEMSLLPHPAFSATNTSGANPEPANAKLAALQKENERLQREVADLARLRAEVARLRETAQPANLDLTAEAMKQWLARVNSLKAHLHNTPAAQIPELQYLTEQDWLDAARNGLNTTNDFRSALASLRSAGENHFISQALQPALKQFEDANNGQFPTDLSQLTSYFDPPVDPSILQRWELVPKTVVPNVQLGDYVLTETSPVDANYDQRNVIGPRGTGSTGGASAWGVGPDVATLIPVMNAYAAAHNGNEPTDPSQLLPYATTAAQQQTLQQLLQERAAK